MKNQLQFFAIFCISAFLLFLPARASADTQLVSSHSQHITYSAFEMDHQGGVVMDVTIGFDTGMTQGYDSSGDLIGDMKEEIMESALSFMDNYPNDTDFFEIVNRGVNAHLRSAFPELENLEVHFRIEPRPGVSFVVLSGTLFENGQLREFYGFDLPGQATDHQNAGEFDLSVWFEYEQNLEPNEIPNVLMVRLNVANFITNYPNNTDFFEIYSKNMAANLLDGFSNIANVNIRFDVPPNDVEVPFVFSSRVYYDREEFVESFGFNVESVETGISGTTAGYGAMLHYVVGIENQEYPNILDVEADFNEFLINISGTEPIVAQLHTFTEMLTNNYADVLRGAETSFELSSDDLPEAGMQYKAVHDGERIRSGAGFHHDFISPDNPDHTLEIFTGLQQYDGGLSGEAAWRNNVIDIVESFPFDGDIIQLNYELSHAASVVDSPAQLSSTSSGTVESEVFWDSGNSLSSSAMADGSLETDSSTDPGSDIPVTVTLDQNYPNPFNPTTNIRYELNTAADVTLEVFNIQGQRIATLVNSFQNAGLYTVDFDAANLSSGVYFYRLQTPGQSETRKMMLVK